MTLNPIVEKVYADSKLSDVQLIEKHIVPNLRNILDEIIMSANSIQILKMAIDMEEGETTLKAKTEE